MASKISSRKARGRAAQQWVRDKLSEALELPSRDCISTTMGDTGADIKLSDEAYKRFPYDIEVKNQESLSIWKAYQQAGTHGEGEPLLFFKRNRQRMLVCMDAEHFIKLYAELDDLRQVVKNAEYK